MDRHIFARCRLVARLTLAIAMLASAAATAQAQALTATLTSPADGAINADPLQPFQWTSVANVQAYVLWVGTSAGANNVVNTPEVQQTSYPAASLPAGVTLYARMWTKVGGVWRSVDSTFSAAALTATLTAPANGASGVNPLLPFQWTSVANAQAYVLWLGTSAGANNVVNTPELQQTSYQPQNLPANVTLYARMWTKVGGVWRSVDSTFTMASVTATLTAPANGATNVDPLQPFQWTSVLNAQAYVLWVGTSAGTNNIVNSPEVQQTSYQPSNLPGGTLYARMWTKVGGVWRFVDSTFTAASLTSTLLSPANGALNVSQSPLFQWTSVLNSQGYVVWIGTTPGANNLLRTNEMMQTSYQSPVVFGPNQTLYARMWAKAGGVWRFTDSSFSTPATPATITAPLNGATGVNPLAPITWTNVSGAQAYVLWVGTSAGTSNVVNSPEVQQTSYQPASLPANQTLYARVWTKIGGLWYSTDSTFTAGSLIATLTYPANGAQNVDDTVPATWAAVPGAESYVLWIGSTQGAHDVWYPSETSQTSQSFLNVPPNRVLYARLWTKAGGVWRSSDSTFEVSGVAPEFIYPADGATAVSVAQPFHWNIARNAQAYRLLVGTTIGGSDLLDSGALAGTSYSASGLTASGPLYARVLAQVGGQWIRHTDILFTLDSSVTPAVIEVPFDGDAAFDSAKAFQWPSVPLARGYRLSIGTTPGGNNLHDSGEIRVTRRFVRNLPLGTLLYGRLQTKVSGQWSATDFTFTVSSNTVSSELEIKSALWATDAVRTMATDDDNRAYAWTQLFVSSYPKYRVVCYDFAVELRQVLTEMNLSTPSRLADVAFDTNGLDGHTLVELWDAPDAKWMLLDPTFDLVPTVAGAWATLADLSAATQAFDWTAIQYQFLGEADDFYVRNYYLDYPLLFLNVGTLVVGQGLTPLPYLASVPTPAASPAQYAIRCTASSSAGVVIDGITMTLACDGIDSLSRVFGASTVAVPNGSTTPFTLYLLPRFVF